MRWRATVQTELLPRLLQVPLWDGCLKSKSMWTALSKQTLSASRQGLTEDFSWWPVLHGRREAVTQTCVQGLHMEEPSSRLLPRSQLPYLPHKESALWRRHILDVLSDRGELPASRLLCRHVRSNDTRDDADTDIWTVWLYPQCHEQVQRAPVPDRQPVMLVFPFSVYSLFAGGRFSQSVGPFFPGRLSVQQTYIWRDPSLPTVSGVADHGLWVVLDSNSSQKWSIRRPSLANEWNPESPSELKTRSHRLL